MRDRHIDVVDDDAKIVRRRAVGTGNDEVVQLAVVEHDIALDQILDHRGAFARRAKTDRERAIGRQIRDDARRRAAGAVVHRLALFFHRRLPLGVQLGGRAHARIGFRCGEQFFDLLLVERKTLGLIKRAFVVIQTEPLHRVQDRLNGLRGGALAIGILDAQDELAAGVAGKKVIEQRGARAADM